MSFNRSGLPGWTYNNEELFELESVNIFKKNWQLVCHESDLPETGDYITYDLLGERALLVRGQDKQIRAFHNLCRHRGSRLVVGERGNCKNVITCPFHAWIYNLDGTLRGPSRSETFMYGNLSEISFGLSKATSAPQFFCISWLVIRFSIPSSVARNK